jgi:hypothetical protein
MASKGVMWHCSGHSPSVLPVDVEGVKLTRFTDLPKLLKQSATRAINVPIAKIYARLLGTPLQQAVERTMERFLTDDDPQVRRAALGFYWTYPKAEGAEKVVSLAMGDRKGFAGVKDEALSEGTDLEARLILTVGQLWMSDAVPDESARDLIRAEALKPGRVRATFASLAFKDPQWLLQNAKEIVMATPDAAGKLLVELERAIGASPALLEIAHQVPTADRDAVARVRADLETYSVGSLREQLLAVFAE